MTDRNLPVWRSLLYVPANQQRFVDGAPRRGADAIILDLEDSIAPGDKAEARRALPGAIETIADSSSDVLVRVNRDVRLLFDDLKAVVHPGVDAINLPKVDDPGVVRIVDEYLQTYEVEAGIAPGSIAIFARIETPRGLRLIDQILAASPRVVGTAIGSGDLTLHGGIDAEAGGLAHAHCDVMTAARAAGVLPLGLAGLILQFNDLDAFERLAVTSRKLGSVGAPCIHPAQVPVLNRVFGLDPREVERAEEIIAAFEKAAEDSKGAFMMGEEFIDYAHYSYAKRIREQAATIAEREEAAS